MITAIATSVPGQPYELKVVAGNHTITADAPAAAGGGARGMTPHEHFLGGIAGCMAMTLWMYAAERKWDLQSVSVSITESMVADPNQPGKKIAQFDEHIRVSGNLSPSEVNKLLAVAPRCPVHQRFVGPKQVATTIAHVPSPAGPTAAPGVTGNQPQSPP